MNRWAFFCLLLLPAAHTWAQLLPSYGDSRTGGSGMQFLKNSFDARATAMAGAVAGLGGDVASLYWNPAGITSTDTCKISFMLAHSRYFANLRANNVATVFKAGKLSYVGISVLAMDYGDNEETTEFQPSGTGRKLVLSNTLVGVTYAKILTSNFSFGLSGKWANEVLSTVSTNNILFDMGLMYNVGLKHSRFGVSFSNFGLNVSPSGEVRILKINNERNQNTFQDISAPAMFRLGFAFDPLHKGAHVLSLTGQLNHPTDNNETYAFGAEYHWMKRVYARSGWEFGADEASLFPPLGFGLKLKNRFGAMGIDYSLVNKERLGNIQRVSLLFSLR